MIPPSIYPTMDGDLMKRANLFRFIREFHWKMNMPEAYYMEFGILNGECMVDAYRQFRGVVSHYYGFDSFEGLPELSMDDERALEHTPMLHQGNFKSMKKQYVKNSIISSCQISDDELTLIDGFFSGILPDYNKSSLNINGSPLCIYIDCDLYSSTVEVLKFIDSLIVTGTWILFDDYWVYRGSPNFGEQKAVREWMRDHERIGLSDYCNFNGFGKAFIAYEK